MAAENEGIPAAQAEWELLSMSAMSASTLGVPSAKPEDSSSLPQESEEPTDSVELSKGKGEETEDMRQKSLDMREESKRMERLPRSFHEDLIFTDQEQNMGISPGFDCRADSSKKLVKVSWWKRQINLSQPQSHKYNTALSIALVAAVVGIAIIGHRWYRERALNNQLRLELAAKDEKLTDVMQQVKDAVTGRRRVAVTRGSFF